MKSFSLPPDARTFCVVNLGCKVNRVEADTLSASLLAAGLGFAAQESADVVFVNTCTVTGEADKKARKAVRHALSVNEYAQVVVTGCAVAINPGEFDALGARVQVVQRAELFASLADCADLGVDAGAGVGAGAGAGVATSASAGAAVGEGSSVGASLSSGNGTDHDPSGTATVNAGITSGGRLGAGAGEGSGSGSDHDPSGTATVSAGITAGERLGAGTGASTGESSHRGAHVLENGTLRMGAGFRTRVNIKIQDGCDHACTYCIVHVARGPAVSSPAHRVLEEARAYFQNGAKELVLAGIDLASYRDGDVGLAKLVQLLLEEADTAFASCAPSGASAPHEASRTLSYSALNSDTLPARVRASSIEPHTLDEALIELLASAEGRLCRHLHLPLQSGSSKVLREMARPYNAGHFREIVEHLYERVPRLSLTTDIIVGFPGETDEDFAQTVELARACRFSKIHVFPYSRREGTPAAARTDQVPADVKSARAAELRQLSDQLRAADLARRAGTEELAIVEDTFALTESYHEVPIPSGCAPGSLIRVRL